MFYVGTGLLILVATFGLFVAYIRVSQSMLENTLRDDIRRYVESKGGTVTFDEKDGMNVTGPLATGYQNLMSVRLIAGDSGGDRELRLGLALSKFVPTKLDEMRAKGAAERIAGAKDAIGALTRDELLAKARVAIVSSRAPTEGLATCSRAVAERFEARVVLEGFDVQGIPTSVRGRLSEDDHVLFETALDKTLGATPALDEKEARCASTPFWRAGGRDRGLWREAHLDSG